MMMLRSNFRYAAIMAGVMLAASSARAGFSVDVYVDNVAVGVITDNALGDSNPAVGDIWYEFDLMDAQNRWRAKGDLFAEGGYNGVPPVSTVVTNTLIEKIANVPLLQGEIDFVHHYAASGLGTHTAHIDGELDNTIDHEVKGASLDYSAEINGQPLGTFVKPFYAGPGPEPFAGDLGPLVLPTTTEHHMQLRFYLDSIGDSIEMFNSAEMHTFVPEPASGCVFAASVAFLASRRARGSQHGNSHG
jgi:hypothetical protein